MSNLTITPATDGAALTVTNAANTSNILQVNTSTPSVALTAPETITYTSWLATPPLVTQTSSTGNTTCATAYGSVILNVQSLSSGNSTVNINSYSSGAFVNILTYTFSSASSLNFPYIGVDQTNAYGWFVYPVSSTSSQVVIINSLLSSPSTAVTKTTVTGLGMTYGGTSINANTAAIIQSGSTSYFWAINNNSGALNGISYAGSSLSAVINTSGASFPDNPTYICSAQNASTPYLYVLGSSGNITPVSPTGVISGNYIGVDRNSTSIGAGVAGITANYIFVTATSGNIYTIGVSGASTPTYNSAYPWQFSTMTGYYPVSISFLVGPNGTNTYCFIYATANSTFTATPEVLFIFSVSTGGISNQFSFSFQYKLAAGTLFTSTQTYITPVYPPAIISTSTNWLMFVDKVGATNSLCLTSMANADTVLTTQSEKIDSRQIYAVDSQSNYSGGTLTPQNTLIVTPSYSERMRFHNTAGQKIFGISTFTDSVLNQTTLTFNTYVNGTYTGSLLSLINSSGGGSSVTLPRIASTVYPITTNTYSLGLSTSYWSNIYVSGISLGSATPILMNSSGGVLNISGGNLVMGVGLSIVGTSTAGSIGSASVAWATGYFSALQANSIINYSSSSLSISAGNGTNSTTTTVMGNNNTTVSSGTLNLYGNSGSSGTGSTVNILGASSSTVANNIINLGSSTYYQTVTIYGAPVINGNILPGGGSYSVGINGTYWATGYITAIYTNLLNPSSGSNVNVAGNFLPFGANVYTLGSTLEPWSTVYAQNFNSTTAAQLSTVDTTSSIQGQFNALTQSGTLTNGAYILGAASPSAGKSLQNSAVLSESSGTVNFAGNIVPSTGSTWSLGSPSKPLANVYANNISGTVTSAVITPAVDGPAFTVTNAANTKNILQVNTATPSVTLAAPETITYQSWLGIPPTYTSSAAPTSTYYSATMIGTTLIVTSVNIASSTAAYATYTASTSGAPTQTFSQSMTSVTSITGAPYIGIDPINNYAICLSPITSSTTRAIIIAALTSGAPSIGANTTINSFNMQYNSAPAVNPGQQAVLGLSGGTSYVWIIKSTGGASALAGVSTNGSSVSAVFGSTGTTLDSGPVAICSAPYAATPYLFVATTGYIYPLSSTGTVGTASAYNQNYITSLCGGISGPTANYIFAIDATGAITTYTISGASAPVFNLNYTWQFAALTGYYPTFMYLAYNSSTTTTYAFIYASTSGPSTNVTTAASALFIYVLSTPTASAVSGQFNFNFQYKLVPGALFTTTQTTLAPLIAPTQFATTGILTQIDQIATANHYALTNFALTDTTFTTSSEKIDSRQIYGVDSQSNYSSGTLTTQNGMILSPAAGEKIRFHATNVAGTNPRIWGISTFIDTYTGYNVFTINSYLDSVFVTAPFSIATNISSGIAAITLGYIGSDIIPLNNNSNNLGNSTNSWTSVYTYSLLSNTIHALSSGGMIITGTYSGASGATALSVYGDNAGNGGTLNLYGGTNTYAANNIINLGASAVPQTITIYGSPLAGTNNTYNLGSSSSIWNTVYTGAVTASGTLNISAATGTSSGTITIQGGNNATATNNVTNIYGGGSNGGTITIQGGNNTTATNNVTNINGGGINGGTVNVFGGQSSTTSNNILTIGSTSYIQTITIYGSPLAGTNNTYNLGSSSSIWNTVYTGAVTASGTLNISAATGTSSGTITIQGGNNTTATNNVTNIYGGGSNGGTVTIQGGNNTTATNNVTNINGGGTNGGTINVFGGQSATTSNNKINIGSTSYIQTITIYGSPLAGTNNTYNLGSSSSIWNTVYTGAVTASGTLNISAATGTSSGTVTIQGGNNATATNNVTNIYGGGSNGGTVTITGGNNGTYSNNTVTIQGTNSNGVGGITTIYGGLSNAASATGNVINILAGNNGAGGYGGTINISGGTYNTNTTPAYSVYNVINIGSSSSVQTISTYGQNTLANTNWLSVPPTYTSTAAGASTYYNSTMFGKWLITTTSTTTSIITKLYDMSSSVFSLPTASITATGSGATINPVPYIGIDSYNGYAWSGARVNSTTGMVTVITGLNGSTYNSYTSTSAPAGFILDSGNTYVLPGKTAITYSSTTSYLWIVTSTTSITGCTFTGSSTFTTTSGPTGTNFLSICSSQNGGLSYLYILTSSGNLIAASANGGTVSSASSGAVSGSPRVVCAGYGVTYGSAFVTDTSGNITIFTANGVATPVLTATWAFNTVTGYYPYYLVFFTYSGSTYAFIYADVSNGSNIVSNVFIYLVTSGNPYNFSYVYKMTIGTLGSTQSYYAPVAIAINYTYTLAMSVPSSLAANNYYYIFTIGGSDTMLTSTTTSIDSKQMIYYDNQSSYSSGSYISQKGIIISPSYGEKILFYSDQANSGSNKIYGITTNYNQNTGYSTFGINVYNGGSYVSSPIQITNNSNINLLFGGTSTTAANNVITFGSSAAQQTTTHYGQFAVVAANGASGNGTLYIKTTSAGGSNTCAGIFGNTGSDFIVFCQSTGWMTNDTFLGTNTTCYLGNDTYPWGKVFTQLLTAGENASNIPTLTINGNNGANAGNIYMYGGSGSTTSNVTIAASNSTYGGNGTINIVAGYGSLVNSITNIYGNTSSNNTVTGTINIYGGSGGCNGTLNIAGAGNGPGSGAGNIVMFGGYSSASNSTSNTVQISGGYIGNSCGGTLSLFGGNSGTSSYNVTAIWGGYGGGGTVTISGGNNSTSTPANFTNIYGCNAATNGAGTITLQAGNYSLPTYNITNISGGGTNGGVVNIHGGTNSTTANNIINIGDSTYSQTINAYGPFAMVGQFTQKGITSGYTGTQIYRGQSNATIGAGSGTLLVFALGVSTNPSVLNLTIRYTIQGTVNTTCDVCGTNTVGIYNSSGNAAFVGGTAPTISILSGGFGSAPTWVLSANQVQLYVTKNSGQGGVMVIYYEYFYTYPTTS
jgi:hypothetical protein